MQVRSERIGSDKNHSQAVHPDYRIMDQTKVKCYNYDLEWKNILTLAIGEKEKA